MLILEPIIHWIHIMAAIVWVGGMVFTALLLAPIARTEVPPQVRTPLFKKIGRRFSKVGWISLLLLISTGSYKVISAWESWNFFLSPYGLALLVKLALVILVLLLSYLHDFVWGPKLSEVPIEEKELQEFKIKVSRLTFWSRVNVILVILIVGIAAWLRMNPF